MWLRCLRKDDFDDTLKCCRELAGVRRNGYRWDDGLVFHDMLDEADVTLAMPLG